MSPNNKTAVKTFHVSCEWDGYKWVASVDELSGGFTQAKRLDQLPARVIEVVKLMTGENITANQVAIQPHIDDEVDEEAELIRNLDHDVHELTAALQAHRRRVARRMRQQGFTLRDIGSVTGVSYQRIEQILNERG